MSPNRDDITRALADTDWTGAQVDHTPRRVSVVHSVRFPADLSDRIAAEADRRGTTPSTLIRDLVETGLTPLADDTTITVRIADLHRAIDTVIKDAA
jgi:predicted DNA-binding protein